MTRFNFNYFNMSAFSTIRYLFILSFFCYTYAFPDPGKWAFTMSESNTRVSIAKSLYKDSQIYVQVMCDPHHPGMNLTIQWMLVQTKCWEDLYRSRSQYPFDEGIIAAQDNRTLNSARSPPQVVSCVHGSHVVLQGAPPPPDVPKPKTGSEQPVYWIPVDGVFQFQLSVRGDVDSGTSPSYNVSVVVRMPSPSGYLSAVDWPLLPFYGAMCGAYVLMGGAWLLVCSLQWRDLLRIQFWIGAVLFLGMIEKATFYFEYSSINSSGLVSHATVLAAEWVSVAKRALARMLVIIVSLGFGIVKPRLGPMLQRVVALGGLWGGLGALEAWLRLGAGSGGPGDALLASAPLALLDAALCWWVFSSLLHTTRTLRLRRNTVKLNLYKHFTNTLIFAVISSLVFMIYSIKVHSITDCLSAWKELWMDDAYWHVLFSVVLLVIMVLWRPTNNNQRYAFTPLLDNADDDDEEEEVFVSDAYGVKMRGYSVSSDGGERERERERPSEEADLRWVEENIPATALPVLDSDEEMLNTKFEVSKMQ